MRVQQWKLDSNFWRVVSEEFIKEDLGEKERGVTVMYTKYLLYRQGEGVICGADFYAVKLHYGW